MTVLGKKRRRTKTALPREMLTGGRLSAERWSGLRLDLKRIDADEQREFYALSTRIRDGAEPHTKRDDPRYLDNDKDRRRYEALVEKMAGVEPGYFDRGREDVKLRAQAAALARRARRLPPREVVLVDGDLVLSKEVLGALWGDTSGTSLDVTTAGMALWLLSIWTAPDLAILPHRGRLEGDTIVYDANVGVLRRGTDPRGQLSQKRSLDLLQKAGLIEHSRSGREGRIKPARYAKAILESGRAR